MTLFLWQFKEKILFVTIILWYFYEISNNFSINKSDLYDYKKIVFYVATNPENFAAVSRIDFEKSLNNKPLQPLQVQV